MDRLALTLKQTATGSGNFTKLVLHYEKIADAIFWVKSQFTLRTTKILPHLHVMTVNLLVNYVKSL